MKLFNLLLTGCSIILAINCQKKEIFPSTHPLKDNFINESKEYSKSREENERKYLAQWVLKRKDSLNQNFEPTSGGIWMRFLKKDNQPIAEKDDQIEYTAEIKALSGNLIYSTFEFGNKKVILGKYHEIRGIETALYKMGKGDITELVLPSFTAYGLYGDENKIQSNVPLIIELRLIDVKKL